MSRDAAARGHEYSTNYQYQLPVCRLWAGHMHAQLCIFVIAYSWVYIYTRGMSAITLMHSKLSRQVDANALGIHQPPSTRFVMRYSDSFRMDHADH